MGLKIFVIKKIKKFIKNNFESDFVELIKHGKNYISAGIFSKGLSFLSVPIFTRLLVPEEYGILAIFGSFVSIFTIIYGLGVKGSVGRYYHEDTNDFNEYYGSILVFILTWGIFLSIILLLIKDKLLSFFQFPVNLIYLGIGVVFSSTTFKIYQSYLQASKQSKKISILKVVRSLTFLILAVTITFLLKDQRYYGKIAARLIVWFIFFFYSAFSIIKISKINFEIKYIKYSLIFGLPVVFHLLSQYILSSFDRVIINQIIGAKETGLYSFAYKVGKIQNIISMAMLKAWTPIFYQKLNENKYIDVENLAKRYSKLVYLLALTLILFSREIIIIMADKQYHASLDLVPVVVFSYVFFFLYTMYVNYSFYYKKTYMISIFTIIAGSINIGLNYLLVPKFGYQAAAWTTLISYSCLFIFHYLNVRFILKPDKITRLKALIPNFLKIVLIIGIFYLLRTYIDWGWTLFIFKIITLIIGVFILYYNKILEIFR